MIKRTIPPQTVEFLEMHFALSGDMFNDLGIISQLDRFGFFYFVPLKENFYQQEHFGIKPISFISDTEINIPSDNPVFSKISADHWMKKLLDIGGTSKLWTLDIGAFLGDFSFLFSLAAEQNGNPEQQINIYAFEPNPLNLNLLRANVSLNEIFSNRIEIKNAACGASDGIQHFICWDRARIGGRLVDSLQENYPGMISSKVEVVRIDSFLDKLPIKPNDVICAKIDTEGGEADVMSGIGQYLSQVCLCILEYWPQTGNIVIEGISFNEYLTKHFDILLMGNSLFSKPLPWRQISSGQELDSYAESVLKNKKNLDIACVNKHHPLRKALIHALT